MSNPKSFSGNAEPPKCARLVTALGIWYSIHTPRLMPATQPAISAPRWNQRVYSPSATAGRVCRMMTPPINCRSMENCGSTKITKATAPNFTSSDVIFETAASCAGVASRFRYSR